MNRLTNIPRFELYRIQYNDLLKLKAHLHSKIIGQNDAINTVVNILINRAEISRGNQLIGLFLFLGKSN